MTPRKYVAIALVAVLALGGSYGFGRCSSSTPAQAVEVHSRTDTGARYVAQTVVKEVVGPVKITTHTVSKPTGEVVTDTVEERAPVVTEASTLAQGEVTQHTESKTITKTARPDWLFSGMVGVSAADLVKGKPLELRYTASVERRIMGPFFAGIYVRTDLEIGLKVSAAF